VNQLGKESDEAEVPTEEQNQEGEEEVETAVDFLEELTL